MFRLSALITVGLAASVLGWIKVPDNWPGRIVGGEDAAPNQFPYQVSLRRNNNHYCGGTIINNCYILSAVHCGTIVGDTVVVGTLFLDNGGVVHNVDRVIDHPNYSQETFENDINLLRVSPYITYSVAVQPMPIGAHYVESGDAVSSGWGHLVAGGEAPNHLQYLNTRIIPYDECAAAWVGSTLLVSATTICTKDPAGRGVCQGDSGGPLVYNGGLHGVTSWAPIECGAAMPDVYTRVASYVSWILTNAV